MSNICTLADVKQRLAIEGKNEYDDMISRIILGVESKFDSETGRRLVAPAEAAAEYYTGCGAYLQLTSYPVVEIVSVKESYSYDFDNEVALTANDHYRSVKGGKNGVLFRVGSRWLGIEDGIEIVHRSGYCAADAIPGANEHALPDDLREAAIEQACFIFKRRDDIGLASVGFEGGSMQKFSAMNLLPFVKDVLNNYERPPL